MMNFLKSAFVQAHIFAISNIGIDLAMQDGVLFREPLTKICPHYFSLFPKQIHHVDAWAEEIDFESSEMGQFTQKPPESIVVSSEWECRVEWEEDIQEWKQQQRVEFQEKCREYYQRWKAQGHADTDLFERFPEWVVAVVPERE
jgi:hypothetical protein